MKGLRQLQLLTIPKQPAPTEVKIDSRVIRAYVRESMLGFWERQECRAEKRAAARAKEKRNTGFRIGEKMREIKVSYRATFRYPIGNLNPLGLRLMNIEMQVEITRVKQDWIARVVLPTGASRVIERINRMPSYDTAKQEVERNFTTVVSRWKPWGCPPEYPSERLERIKRGDMTPNVPRQLEKWEFIEPTPNRFLWKDVEDFTHLLLQQAESKKKEAVAACGREVNFKNFVSIKAKIPPTCHLCAEKWSELYGQ